MGIVSDVIEDVIDWAVFAQCRTELGHGFVRILGYFRDDGSKSVDIIEAAIRSGSAVPLVLPAHTLKSEARQFGALKLAALAEHIELVARDCVEWHQEPAALVEHVINLRPLFEKSIVALERESSPLMQRQHVFGRGVAAVTKVFNRF
jgi:histidine phosphotransfer protein HptB